MEYQKDFDSERARSWGRDVRLLVVDDEEFLRSVISERLKIEGFSVDEAQNGMEALARLSEDEYSILLTDIRMPEMDGVITSYSIHYTKLYENTDTGGTSQGA